MPYSGYIVRYQPDCLPKVLATLNSFRDLAVGEPDNQGLPIAATTSTSEEAMTLNERLEQLPGVLSVSLVYHNFEDTSDIPSETSPAPDCVR